MNNYDFPIVKRGYDPEEVDACLEELNSRISYLQEQNLLMQAKLAEAQDMIDKYSKTEKELRVSIADSKRAAAEMLSDARDRSAALIDASRGESCKIIDDLDRQIEDRYKTIQNIKANVSAFKSQLFDLYAAHIEDIEAFASLAENFAYTPDFTQLSLAIDTFEEGGEPVAPPVPQFPEMPEESYFADAHKLEPKDFSLSEEAIIKIEDEAELAAAVPADEFFVGELAEAETEIIDSAALNKLFVMEDSGEIFSEIMDEEFVPEEDESIDLSILDGIPGLDPKFDEEYGVYGEAEEEAETEEDVIDEDDEMFREATKEDEEYFRFLNDFINED